MRPEAIVDVYLRAVTAADLATLERLVHPEYTFCEWPNAITPAGGERDRAASLAGVEAGSRILAEHAFEVRAHLVCGDTVASRMTWRGRLAADGRELTAHVSQFTTLRDGRIFRTESFDCYEPFGA